MAGPGLGHLSPQEGVGSEEVRCTVGAPGTFRRPLAPSSLQRAPTLGQPGASWVLAQKSHRTLKYLPGNTALQLQQLRPAVVFVGAWVVL